MDAALPACPTCGADFPAADWAPAGTGEGTCPRCGTAAILHVFPALYRPPSNTTPAAASLPGDATCFRHADRVAVVACDSCGRFLCGLCDLDLGSRHLCAACLQSEHEAGGQDGRHVSRIIQYDSLALALAVVPPLSLIFWFLSIFSAPAALLLSIRYWRRPMSIVRRTKWRFLLALLISLATILGWVAGIYLAIQGARTVAQTSKEAQSHARVLRK